MIVQRLACDGASGENLHDNDEQAQDGMESCRCPSHWNSRHPDGRPSCCAVVRREPPGDHPIPSIFDPRSTPAESIRHLSYFVLGITGVIFLVVFSLLSYVVMRFAKQESRTPIVSRPKCMEARD